MSVYEDMNVINLSVLDEAALLEFYSNNLNRHFWFQRADIGLELKYCTILEQTTSHHQREMNTTCAPISPNSLDILSKNTCQAVTKSP